MSLISKSARILANHSLLNLEDPPAYKIIYSAVDEKPEVTCKCLKRMVGANGFEPSTSWSRTRRASQAALRPDCYTRMLHCKPSRASRLSQLLTTKLQRSFPKQSFPAFRAQDPLSILRSFSNGLALPKNWPAQKRTAGKQSPTGGFSLPCRVPCLAKSNSIPPKRDPLSSVLLRIEASGQVDQGAGHASA